VPKGTLDIPEEVAQLLRAAHITPEGNASGIMTGVEE